MKKDLRVFEGANEKSSKEKVNWILEKVILGQTITINFLFLTRAIKITGMIIKIDKSEEALYLPNFKIPFNYILDIVA